MRKLKHKPCQVCRIFYVSFVFCAVTAYAETAEDLISMTESFIEQNLDHKLHNPSISVIPPKGKIAKPACTHQPFIHQATTNQIGSVSVILSCQSPVWQQRMTAIIDGEYAVVMTSADIPAKTVITPAMLTQRWIPANNLRPNYYTQIKDIVNKTSKHFISANSILADNMLKNTQLIQKGQEIKMIVQQQSMLIEMYVTALEAGELNQLIRVKNATSGKIIEGKVTSAETVTLP